MFYKNLICLVIGIIIGVRLTDFWDYVKLQNQHGSNKKHNLTLWLSPTLQPTGNNYISIESLSAEMNSDKNVKVSLAKFLFNETRVLCWIMTTPENHLKRALHVKLTWGARCNKLIFVSTESDRYLKTVKLPMPEGRSHLWNKTREAFRYVYERHYDEADWFLKADDDTYVIMENLRAFLYQFSADAPVYFGCKFHPFVKQGYMSGGAGYVLSKEALRRFAEVAYANTTLCSQNKLSEDKEMGICLQNVGVVAGDSRDMEGQERFMPLAPMHLIPIDTSEWYAEYLFYKRDQDVQCCSRRAISFHYIKPKEFYLLDYVLYRLRPFGMMIDSIVDTLPLKANMTESLHKWRTTQSDSDFNYFN